MKKGLLFILMVGASVCLSAQEKGKTEGKAYTVETNRFGANWFISGGVGGQMYFGDNDGKADFGKRIAPALDIAVGKWFTPGIGLRVAYNGLQAKGAAPSANDLYTKGGKYSNGYYKQKWNMANFHGDVLFNLSNMFCGYNEDRLYSFIPYVGAGVALSWSEPHQQNLGINAGLINRFRVSDAWDINLELRGLLMKDAFGGTSKEGMAGVTVGVTYKFKKRGFNAVPTVPMVPESHCFDVHVLSLADVALTNVEYNNQTWNESAFFLNDYFRLLVACLNQVTFQRFVFTFQSIYSVSHVIQLAFRNHWYSRCYL